MELSNQIKNQHLVWRAGFGPMPETLDILKNTSQANFYQLLSDTSSKKPSYLNVASTPLYDVKGKQLTQEQRRHLRRQNVQDLSNLNLSWLREMINSESQLREKMSLFWHGHFACRLVNIQAQQQLLNVIRINALGNFGDLLREVSKSPAMLSFLNNQQNKKAHPNENFAREVMELFTMGRGNYTETDVKEGARAFTGWGYNKDAEFVDRKYLHDTGTKKYLGKTGNFDGDDILNIILEQKATAVFITRKIYKFFVVEEPDEIKVKQLAGDFYQSNYDLKKLMDSIFRSNWFYDQKNIGTHIKSPVELMVGIQRLIPLELAKPAALILFQRALGQYLFYPPNVAGWPGGKNWIDSSSLMLRMRMAQILTNADSFSIKPKSDDDVMMGLEGVEKENPKQRLNVDVNWNQIASSFEKTDRTNLLKTISQVVLQSKKGISSALISKYLDNSSREAFIKTTLVELMSTPEYQLC